MQKTLILPGVVLAMLMLPGCEEDQIQAYDAPRDAPAPVVTASPTLPGGAGEAGGHPITWDVPADWTPSKNPPGFVLAAYDAGGEGSEVQATVSTLAGEGGGAVANINRWRGQIGLPSVSTLEEQPMQRIDTGDGPAAFVDLVGEAGPSGEPARILGAILPRPGHNDVWFFKMTGPRDKVEAQKQAFIDVVASSKHEHTHGHAHEHEGHDHDDHAPSPNSPQEPPSAEEQAP